MRTTTRKSLRCLAAALTACTCLGAATALADSTDDAVRKANGIAYRSAIKCFVAEGSIAGRKKDAGDTAQQAKYEAMARQSFDIAKALGGKLGYSGNRISQDFGLTQTEELPQLVGDSAHLNRVMSMCAALGL